MGNYYEALGECHVIAYIYHWGRNEIFNLTITERKKFIELIEYQKEQENGSNELT